MVTLVKVCGLTTREDAEFAAECGADALGFVFDPASPRRVADADLPRSLGPFRLCVGVFGAFQPVETGCALVQCTEGEPLGRYVRAVRLRAEASVQSVLESLRAEPTAPEAVLLDAYVDGQHGGTGHGIDWGLAAELVAALDVPVILAGGLHPGNVAEAIRRVRPYGVDASSGLESRPGVKDPERVRAFVDQAKSS